MTVLVPPGNDAPATADIEGHVVALHYGDPAAEYASLRTGVIVVDRSHRHRLRMTGRTAAEMLTGLVTNDVKALSPGLGQYAAALTAKGKIVADLRIFAQENDSFLIDTSRRAAAGWMQVVRKYVNPRLAAYADQSDSTSDIGVFGARATQAVSECCGLDAAMLGELAPYSHCAATVVGMAVTVARVPDLEVDGYELFAPADSLDALLRHLTEWNGAMLAGLSAWEVARIEAGRPEWGLDIDETTIPQEANLDELHAISYTKGCYTGQETVARVHFRGHVNKHLRGVRCSTLPGESLPPKTQLFDDAAKTVGDVRSFVVSPRLGGIALAMIRREIAPGTTLTAKWDGGGAAVTVSGLPFGA